MANVITATVSDVASRRRLERPTVNLRGQGSDVAELCAAWKSFAMHDTSVLSVHVDASWQSGGDRDPRNVPRVAHSFLGIKKQRRCWTCDEAGHSKRECKATRTIASAMKKKKKQKRKSVRWFDRHPDQQVVHPLTGQIFVKTLSGKTITLSNVCVLNNVLQVKHLIQEREGVPWDAQRLIFGGKLLDNNRSLSDQGVTQFEVTLHLVVQLRGGMDKDSGGRSLTLGAFDGTEAMWPEFEKLEIDPWLASAYATEVKGYPEDAAEYANIATADPRVWELQDQAHNDQFVVPDFVCVDPTCVTTDGINWHHYVADLSPQGKEKRRKFAVDSRAGAMIRKACSKGTVAWLTLMEWDQGLASRILRRLRFHFRDASKRAFERVLAEFESIRVDPTVAHTEQIERWMNDVMTKHQEMQRLVRAEPMLMPLAMNEQQIIAKLRALAPPRHRTSSEWRMIRNSRVLSEFFNRMIEWDRTTTDDSKNDVGHADEMAGMANAIAGAKAEDEAEDETPGKNGLFKHGRNAGKPIKCWICKDKDHTKNDCPKHDGREQRKRKPDGGAGRHNGRGGDSDSSKKFKTMKVCEFFLRGGDNHTTGCRFGDQCKWDHPKVPQVAAATGGNYYNAAANYPPPPPDSQMPAGFSVTPDDVPAAQPAAFKVSKCTKTGQWLYMPMVAMAMCMVSMASGVHAATHGNIQDITSATSLTLPIGTSTSKVYPPQWQKQFKMAARLDSSLQQQQQQLSDGFAHMTSKVYVGQTQACAANSSTSYYDTDTGQVVNRSRWMLDGGANINCTSDRTRISNFRGTKTIKGVQDASGKVHEVKGVGECMLEVDCGVSGKRILRIEKVLYVPTFTVSIISESWARSAGFGYHAPPTNKWHTRPQIRTYDADGKVEHQFRLESKDGLNFVEGIAVDSVTQPVLNHVRYFIKPRAGFSLDAAYAFKKHGVYGTSDTFREATDNDVVHTPATFTMPPQCLYCTVLVIVIWLCYTLVLCSCDTYEAI